VTTSEDTPRLGWGSDSVGERTRRMGSQTGILVAIGVGVVHFHLYIMIIVKGNAILF